MRYEVYYQRFFSLLSPVEMRGRYLGFTHRLVREVEAPSLGDVFYIQQGEIWSPHGEARTLISRLQLSHTSMSVGDVVKASNNSYWLCNYRGWTLLHQPVQDQDPPLWLATMVEVRETSRIPTFLKISNDRDCLPPDAYSVESFGWTAFEDMVTLAKKLEQYPGFTPGVQVCIDVGDRYYETEP